MMDRFRQQCRRHGLRVTPQRTAIYRELIRRKDHPSLEMLQESLRSQMPEISCDTVYRTVATFERIGLADRIAGFGATMRFDGNTVCHHHFHCVRCGAIIDVDDPRYDALTAPVTMPDGCEVDKVYVTIEGLCPACRGHESLTE